MKTVFICSRYAGDIKKNVETAKELCSMAAHQGYIPFAPHLLYPQFLDDKDPCQREIGISAGHIFMGHCDEMWVYRTDGISEGMRQDIAQALKLGKKITYLY